MAGLYSLKKCINTVNFVKIVQGTNRPLSKNNTDRAALQAVLPVII